MKSLKKILGILSVLAAASALHAQQAPAVTTQETPGLLGKRVAQLGFSYTDVKHSSTDGYGATSSVNLPVNANLDVTASYNYDWVESHSSSHAQTLGLAATSYTTWGTVKPFFTGGLGYTWPHKLVDVNRVIYGVETGLEVEACSKAALTFAVGYNSDFKAGDNSTFSATVGANVWLTKEIAGTASVSLLDGGHMQYAVGIAYRF